jgi:NAD dependent epimerase/dehydratase family enzyme
MSWISLHDLLGIFEYALHSDSMNGPHNAVAPIPVTNREFTKTLGKVLHRPTLVPAPAFVLRGVFGEIADALLLSSSRVVPAALLARGYSFQHPSLENALRFELGLPST